MIILENRPFIDTYYAILIFSIQGSNEFYFFAYVHFVFNNINHYNPANFYHHKKFQLRKSRRMKENLMLKIFTLGLTVLAGVHGKSDNIS